MSVYVVTGPRAYRGHQPGSTFEASLDPLAAQRALDRGAIQVVEQSRPSLQPGSVTVPPGWLTRKEEANER